MIERIKNPFVREEVPFEVELFINTAVPKLNALMEWSSSKSVYWFFSENPGLGMAKPVDLIARGEGYLVLEFINDSIRRHNDKARQEDKAKAEAELARSGLQATYVEPRPVGRPTDYRPEMCQELVDWMAQGYSFETYAANIGQTRSILYTWANKHPEFADAKERGQQLSLKWFEGIAKTAMTTGMLKLPDGRVVPQAMNATVFRMVAFNKYGWRDKIDHTHTGKNGGPIRLESMNSGEISSEVDKIAQEIRTDLDNVEDPPS